MIQSHRLAWALMCGLPVLAEPTCGACQEADLVYSVDGAFNSGYFGLAVAGIGDTDGDGVPDFVAAEPGTTYLRRYSGRTGALLAQVVPQPWFDFIGHPMAELGDVDGDGIRDLAVGSGDTFGTYPVAVVSGATLKPLYQVHGDDPFFTFGKQGVTGLDDVDGDGVEDFAVSDYFDTDPSMQFAGGGVIYTYSGADGHLIRKIIGPGTVGSEGLGYGLASAGDFDGDGVGDIAAGTANPNSVSVGYARIYSGATGEVLLHVDAPPESQATFGQRVCVPGDLDGDGQSDLLVSSTHVFVGTGAVYAHSGSDGALIWTAVGEANGDAFGEALEPIGDLDGDGVVDIAIGSHDTVWTGAGFTNPGYVRVVSGATSEQLLRFDAGVDSKDGSWFGARLANVGDVNGDGVPELLVGVRNWPVFGGQLKGRIQLYSLGLRSLRPDVTTVSVATGGTQLLRMRPGPEWGGALYVLAGSATGIVPELPLLGPGGPHTLPLVLDAYTTATLAAPGAFLAGSVGLLSETGVGLATLTVPQGLGPAFVGTSVQHAFVLLDPALGVTFASNAAPLLLAP